MSSSVELVPVKPELIPNLWLLAKDNIIKVLDRFEDGEDLEDIYQDLLDGSRQLWIVLNNGEVVASVLTMINEYRGKRYGVLTHAGGRDCEDWFHIVNPIGEYFKSEGCKRFQIFGRRGWLRYLTDFHSERCLLEKDL